MLFFGGEIFKISFECVDSIRIECKSRGRIDVCGILSAFVCIGDKQLVVALSGVDALDRIRDALADGCKGLFVFIIDIELRIIHELDVAFLKARAVFQAPGIVDFAFGGFGFFVFGRFVGFFVLVKLFRILVFVGFGGFLRRFFLFRRFFLVYRFLIRRSVFGLVIIERFVGKDRLLRILFGSLIFSRFCVLRGFGFVFRRLDDHGFFAFVLVCRCAFAVCAIACFGLFDDGHQFFFAVGFRHRENARKHQRYHKQYGNQFFTHIFYLQMDIYTLIHL